MHGGNFACGKVGGNDKGPLLSAKLCLVIIFAEIATVVAR
jgi:hypothetical protein